jgi:two-component system, NtrC family, sensor kinase
VDIFEIFPIAMTVCNTKGDVLLANPACRDLLDSLHIPHDQVGQMFPPDYRRMINDVVAENEVVEQDHQYGGRFLHFIFRVSEDGSQMYVFIRDVTSQEEAKAQLIQNEKMASLGLLIAGLAHEINTPLGAIHSNNDILSRSLEKIREFVRADSDANRFMDIASEVCRNNAAATDRLMSIVGSLKNFARLDESECKEVDIHEGLDSTLTLVQHLLRNRIRVVKDYGALPPVGCFANRLNQVFMNLFVNAAQAISDQGTITIKTWTEGDSVKISVADTGGGILPDNLSKVFDPGFTTKGVGVGTGLGLSICYKIIKEHGGAIDVESDAHGSTFTITLPIVRATELDHA